MKDPIVEEVRLLRDQHAQQFQGDLHLICEDLRQLESSLQDRIIMPSPRSLDEEPPKSLKRSAP